MRRILRTALAALCTLTGGLAAQQRVPDFAREIRPLLSDRCFSCHGPDEAAREGGLRLDSKEDAFRHRGWRPAPISPGQPGSSSILTRMRSEDPDHRMPPPESGKSLSAEEIDKIERWIAAGAPWEEHWSFTPPRESELPAVGRESWVRSPLDRFVLARLEAEGLAPSEPADPRTLLRRVHLDLTGLPPTPEVVEAFAANPSDAAYERLVERLLRSEEHAEHQARIWLDAARYGDTHGLHLDNYREMWPYRDWVIQAFAENLPYDRFGTEQLAGDLLSDAELEDRIATGFNRCHVSTNEGGSIAEEVRIRNVVDRTSTYGTVFLGLTMGCAVCHDHKFDPITMRDFYGLSAFFNNVDGPPMDGNKKAHAPVVRVRNREQTLREDELDLEVKEIEAEIRRALDSFEYREPEREELEDFARREVTWFDDAFPQGSEPAGDAAWTWVNGGDEPVASGMRSLRIRAEGLQKVVFSDASSRLRIGRGDHLVARVRLDPSDTPEAILLELNVDGGNAWRAGAFWSSAEENPWEGEVGFRWRGGDLPAPGAWVSLVIPLETLQLTPSEAIHGLGIRQQGGTAWWDDFALITASEQAPGEHLWVDDVLPRGARAQGDRPIWKWVSGPDHPVKHGTRSFMRTGGNGLYQDFFTDAKPPLELHAGDRLFAWAWLDVLDPPRSVQLQFHDGSGWEHRVRWGDAAHGPGRKGGADHRAGDLPELGRWVRLEIGLAEVGLAPGAKLSGMAFTQVGGTVWWDAGGIRTWHLPDPWPQRSFLAWTKVARYDSVVPQKLRDRALRPLGDDEESRNLKRYFLQNVLAEMRPVLDPLNEEIERSRGALNELRSRIPTTLVMQERAEMRAAHVLERGQYDQKGDVVERRTPAALPPMGESAPRDRLGLARWTFDPGHPLTARVQVNRLWQQVFGVGLVKTSEDFGSQGEPPSHPELLDWLARRFVATGWNNRAMLRELILSAAYRQSSSTDAELLRLDPENRLLARASRHRLDAEVIRDQALHVSGLLVQKIGGPSVKPPQPDGLWKAVGYSSSNTVRFRAESGSDRVHRRTLYTFLKRTAPAPQLSTFDAPNRETCVVRRERTNTPLQALLLLNDPQFVEAARALSQRVLREMPEDGDAERAARLFQLATLRLPDEFERGCLLTLLWRERKRFEQQPAEARALTSIGEAPLLKTEGESEIAAWTSVANLVLNLDEVVVRG